MTNIPDYNFPKLFKVEKKLKKLGYKIFNPARISKEVSKKLKLPLNEIPKEIFMQRDLYYLSQADGVFILNGWNKSDGCLFEIEIVNKLKLFKLYEKDI